jgi:sacsin
MAHLRVLVTQVARDYPNHPGVLSDIVATYQYLNERAEDAKAQLAQLRDEPLFLNVDRPEEDGVMWQSHWNSASTISFDVRDVRGFKFARIFLQRFRLLLVAAGAQEVNGLSTQQVARTDAYARVRGKYLQMRRARLLVDVVFVPLRDDDPDNLLFGHRSFIATQSNHLMSAFTSGFNESGSASAENPVKVEAHYSRLCVSLVVGEHLYRLSSELELTGIRPDFMYTDIVESTSLEVLLEALGLARYWEMEELVEVLQEHIAGGWLHPDTLAQSESLSKNDDPYELKVIFQLRMSRRKGNSTS